MYKVVSDTSPVPGKPTDEALLERLDQLSEKAAAMLYFSNQPPPPRAVPVGNSSTDRRGLVAANGATGDDRCWGWISAAGRL